MEIDELVGRLTDPGADGADLAAALAGSGGAAAPALLRAFRRGGPRTARLLTGLLPRLDDALLNAVAVALLTDHHPGSTAGSTPGTAHGAGAAGFETLLERIGPGLVPALQRVRADGRPPLRRRALHALAAVGGAGALSDRDRALVERLIRVKLTAERPRPLPDHWWIAVPGDRYEGVFEALGLHDRVPVTLELGLSVRRHDTHYPDLPDGSHGAVHRVFVTPELAGWRLVYAETPIAEMQWWPHDTIARISAVCGQAQFFHRDAHGDSTIWAVAVDGRVRRGYWSDATPEWTGAPLPWEEPADDSDLGELDDDAYAEEPLDPNRAATVGITTAARQLSVDPASVSADTPMRGHGWLAVTAAGVGHGPFAGALRI
ncbi:hypothetical protein [Kitasatospora sp. NBC_01539]|uniref:hypothetical protein n=1 Tax=Kitasatospora sp. NBC_01539 TaxID=2903577 RepID=UPI003860286A